jgi:hypothetical protein
MARRRAAHFVALAPGMMLLAAPHAARADIIYSNFGAGFSYDVNAGNRIGSDFAPDRNAFAQGEAFTPTQTYTLTSIELPLSFASTGDGPLQEMTSAPITVSLTSDNSNAPGTTLESFVIATGTQLSQIGVNTTPFTFGSIPLTLNAGTQYWVTVSAGSTPDGIVWNWNPDMSNTENENAFSIDGGTTWGSVGDNNDGAFEVDGTLGGVGPQITTPELGSWSLIASGGFAFLFGAVFSRSRRNRLAPAICRA